MGPRPHDAAEAESQEVYRPTKVGGSSHRPRPRLVPAVHEAGVGGVAVVVRRVVVGVDQGVGERDALAGVVVGTREGRHRVLLGDLCPVGSWSCADAARGLARRLCAVGKTITSQYLPPMQHPCGKAYFAPSTAAMNCLPRSSKFLNCP